MSFNMDDENISSLCKEVYEKTGLLDKYCIDRNNLIDLESLTYSCDYLLNELPRVAISKNGNNEYNAWSRLLDDIDNHINYVSDSPIKSLLKLTLALHEANELQ